MSKIILPLVKRLSIQDRHTGEVVPFQPNYVQEKYYDEIERQILARRPVRIIVLKARQMGISTATLAFGYAWSFVFHRFHELVIAHETDLSETHLETTDMFWENDPHRIIYHPKNASRKHKSWEETGSSIRIATAKNVKSGRGKTPRLVHGSEVAFWDKAIVLMTGLNQSIPEAPNTFVFLESTANGVGNYFYQQWQMAEAGQSDYIPMFFPWFDYKEYRASFIGMEYKSLGPLDEEEIILRKMGVDDDQLSWRRWAIRNKCNNDLNQFHQEYPATPEEAFIASGTNVFPVKKLARCYEPYEPRRGRLMRNGAKVEFIDDSMGPLSIWRWPSPDRQWGVYMVAGDPTKTTTGDPACAQVFSRRNLEQVAVWHGKIDAGTFAEELAKLGKYYNDAVITTEITGPGGVTIGRLLALEYPYIWRHSKPDQTPGNVQVNYGWDTTFQSKHTAVGWLLKVVADGDIKIHDKRTFYEMRDYVTLEGGGYGPASKEGGPLGEGGHDDTVMSLAIGMACHFMEVPVQAYSGPEDLQQKPEPVWTSWEQQEEGLGA